MTHYLVKSQYDEALKVKLYKEPIEDEGLKDENGNWPPCLSPRSRESFVPHYYVETYEDPELGLRAFYKAQFFVEDMEYDSFIVEVVECGDYCETYLHSCPKTILDANLLMGIACLVEEIEAVLIQIADQHDKALGIKEITL